MFLQTKWKTGEICNDSTRFVITDPVRFSSKNHSTNDFQGIIVRSFNEDLVTWHHLNKFFLKNRLETP